MTLRPLGAAYQGAGRTVFTVWAPKSRRVELLLHGAERRVTLTRDDWGYHTVTVADAPPGTRYWFMLEGENRRADPCSRWQPDGVHGPSAVLDPAFAWTDGAWRGLPLSHYVIYELHVGAFSPAGTFDGVIAHLDELAALGITAIELMPVAQFPGARNWGYDGVFPFAAQNAYGGPDGLRRLVDACHARGLAVVLDVVYNHLGPEGNFLSDFAPYFTDHYRSPWGDALNFDGAHSDEVRAYFIANARFWTLDMHIDALRLDAIHAIVDASPIPFLAELVSTVRRDADTVNRNIHLIAESDAGAAYVVRSQDLFGYGMSAQWNDDFHHALHALLTGERAGYYEDFGDVRQLARSLREGYVFTGEYMHFRKRRHGSPSRDLPAERFVVFSQNHDQIGNRMLGERLITLAGAERQKLAAGAVLLGPFVPLLFMGEEYGETNPFLYFVSHSDADLVRAVREGRQREFAAFGWAGEPPDPQAEATFLASKLDHTRKREPAQAAMLAFYRALLRLRRETPALALLDKHSLAASADPDAMRLQIYRRHPLGDAWMCFNFSAAPAALRHPPEGRWRRALDSSASAFGGPGAATPEQYEGGAGAEFTLAPLSFVLYLGEHSTALTPLANA